MRPCAKSQCRTSPRRRTNGSQPSGSQPDAREASALDSLNAVAPAPTVGEMTADSGESVDDQGHGLTKAVWTDADFDVMGWHDCKLYALALIQDDEDDFAGRLFLDLDYIVRWAGGGTPGELYSFWISPATLIFHGVYHLEGSITQSRSFPEAFEIDGLNREPVDDRLGYDRWTIESELAISFRAAGFRQIMRREPLHVPDQHLAMQLRGGISFSAQPYDGAHSGLNSTHAANPPPVRRID